MAKAAKVAAAITAAMALCAFKPSTLDYDNGFKTALLNAITGSRLHIQKQIYDCVSKPDACREAYVVLLDDDTVLQLDRCDPYDVCPEYEITPRTLVMLGQYPIEGSVLAVVTRKGDPARWQTLDVSFGRQMDSQSTAVSAR